MHGWAVIKVIDSKKQTLCGASGSCVLDIFFGEQQCIWLLRRRIAATMRRKFYFKYLLRPSISFCLAEMLSTCMLFLCHNLHRSGQISFHSYLYAKLNMSWLQLHPCYRVQIVIMSSHQPPVVIPSRTYLEFLTKWFQADATLFKWCDYKANSGGTIFL